MVAKWIVCDVKNNLKKEFSLAQEQWKETQNVIGFIGQVGGWDMENKKTACIISFWENEKFLKLFMKNIHDKIFFSNNQSEYYNSIHVEYYTSLLEMEVQSSSIIDLLSNVKLLRIEICKVKQEKIEHFEMVKKNIWFPEMKKVKGMLGGYYSKAVSDSSRYLVSTFWDNIGDSKSYIERELQGHKENADTKNEIDQITKRQILLVDSWKIIKKTAANS
jgi:heme-degrading monooxygenase HmoA